MYVLVYATNDEDFVIVADWLCPEKLLRLLERAIHALYLAHFRVQGEAVGNPAVVTSEDQYFRVVEWEAAHGVTG